MMAKGEIFGKWEHFGSGRCLSTSLAVCFLTVLQKIVVIDKEVDIHCRNIINSPDFCQAGHHLPGAENAGPRTEESREFNGRFRILYS